MLFFRIKSLEETGILKYFEKKYIRYDDRCARKLGQQIESRALPLEESISVFIILSIGIVTAMIVLILEILSRKVCLWRK